MGILEEIEKLKEAEQKEEEAASVPEVEEEKEPEIVSEPEKQEEPEPEQEKPDNQAAAMARLAREKRALEKRLEEEQKAKPAPAVQEVKPTQDDPEPDPADVEDHLRWQLRQVQKKVDSYGEFIGAQQEERRTQEMYTNAIRGFMRFENEFKASAPDYDNVAKHMQGVIYSSIKALNPRMSAEDIAIQTRNQILQMAGSYAQQGLNPAEEMYHLAKEQYGYTPAPVSKEEEAPKGPSVKTVSQNRAKSVTSLSGPGTGKEPAIWDGTTAGLMRLTPAQRAEIAKREGAPF